MVSIQEEPVTYVHLNRSCNKKNRIHLHQVAAEKPKNGSGPNL